MLAGFLAAAESGERLGQVVVDVRGCDSAAHRLLPARNRAFQLLALGQRRAEPLQRVRIVAPLLERLLEPGDGLAVAVLAEERGSHPLECRGPLRLQREGVRDPLLGPPGLALREGVPTVRSALALARRHDVSLPICAEVAAVLFDGKPAADALASLLGRAPTREDAPVEGRRA